ncbi:ABC transporter ATP-binding protein [Schaalia hyovaginalis]|uniref:ABC-2 type transport system ATP-binding protein n=1 Tax=Schaalia hyovaginalis TaxID=29316 RepID=A0A923IXL0_9ACTO|nr:ABC transporter ATP-binding protein [Schaalia hyovaginalis]MBB6334235.1 ABC-2 type transport system ATP-binding protein [Schaalia hyovaginalis]
MSTGETAPSARALIVRDLKKHYGSRRVLHGASFALAAGRIVALLGANGSGKSTLLHALTGVVAPSSGEVIIMGEDHRTPQAKELMGFAPDALPLPANLTGHEYLELVKALQPRHDAALAAKLARLLDVPIESRRLVCEYSHGMKKKLQVVAALAHRPRLLILDEPYSGLDPLSSSALRALVRTFAAQGGSALVATHDLSAAEEHCDCVLILNEGSIIASGTPSELREEHGSRSLEEAFFHLLGGESPAQQLTSALEQITLTTR